MTDRKFKKKIIFKDFPGIADSIILLRLECTINPQNFMNIVETIFEKRKILNYFLMRLPLILKVDRKKKRQEIFATGLQISNLNKIGQLV